MASNEYGVETFGAGWGFSREEILAGLSEGVRTWFSRNSSLFPMLSGGWAGVAIWILDNIASACTNPSATAEKLIEEAQNRDHLTVLEPRWLKIQSVKLPQGAKTVTQQVSVKADGDTQIAALYLPFDQTVTVEYSGWAHSSICLEQITEVTIVGNQNGMPVRVFQRSVRGDWHGLTTETKSMSGKEQIPLVAGGYLLRVTATNEYSGGSMVVTYQVPAEVGYEPGKPNYLPLVLIVGGAGLALWAMRERVR